MSFMRKIKFERFPPPSGTDEEDDVENDHQSSRIVPTSDFLNANSNGVSTTSSSSFPDLNSSQPNNNRSFFEWLTTKRLVVVTAIYFLVQLAFVILVSYIVRCDENKLINYYEERKTSMENAYSVISEKWQETEIEYEKEYESQKIQWIPYKKFDTKLLESMEPAGTELYGGQNLLLYVARAEHLNGTVAGKYCPYMGSMYVGYLGKEMSKPDFEILSYPHGALSWIPANSGNLAKEEALLVAGKAPLTGESTFICRAILDNHLVIGKYLASRKRCLIAYMHTESDQETFEILAINEMGKIMKANA